MNRAVDVSRCPFWFRAVAVIALLWNLLGVAAFLMDATLSAEAVASLPPAQQQLYAARPGWAVAAYAVAVFAGALGCLMLVLRRKAAVLLLVLSLVAVLAQTAYLFLLSDTFAVMGRAAMVMPLVVLVISLALVALARSAAARGWLR